MFMQAASSFGLKSNDFPQGVQATLLDYLNERKISWRFYFESTPTFAMFLERYLELRKVENRFVPMSQFATDAAAGKLPQVSFIDPNGTGSVQMDHSDEHPPTPATVEQSWLAKAIGALAAAALGRSAMFISYDGTAGSTITCRRRGHAPDDRDSTRPTKRLRLWRARAVFVISMQKGYVSLTSTITPRSSASSRRASDPALSHRGANALAPWDAFDFAASPGERAGANVPRERRSSTAAEAWGVARSRGVRRCARLSRERGRGLRALDEATRRPWSRRGRARWECRHRREAAPTGARRRCASAPARVHVLVRRISSRCVARSRGRGSSDRVRWGRGGVARPVRSTSEATVRWQLVRARRR
jgi:hypothetical protein